MVIGEVSFRSGKNRCSADRCLEAMSRDRLESADRRERQSPLSLRFLDDRFCKRMVRTGLDAGFIVQYFPLGKSGEGDNIGDLWLSFGQGSGLIKHDSGDP